jgi:hypothetical protein
MSGLVDCYLPKWLYLQEFMDALPGNDDADKHIAIALLVRDRIIVDGHLNEAEFRFLEGKPDLRTSAWVARLTADDFWWSTSQMLAGVDTSKPGSRVSDSVGLLIEIASTALDHFGGTNIPRRKVTKVGAPELYDWDEIQQFVAKKLTDNGDYGLRENKVKRWRTRADLIELTKDHLQKLKMDVPSETQLKTRIGEFVEHWRSIQHQKVGN